MPALPGDGASAASKSSPIIPHRSKPHLSIAHGRLRVLHIRVVARSPARRGLAAAEAWQAERWAGKAETVGALPASCRRRPAAASRSGSSRPASGGGGDQLGEELLDAGVEVVADGSDLLDGPAGRIVEVPVLVALAGVDGAGVA